MCPAAKQRPPLKNLISIIKDTQPMPGDHLHELKITGLRLDDEGLFCSPKPHVCKIEFIGEPEMETVLDNDNNDYDFSQPSPAERAQNVNYSAVQPLDKSASAAPEVTDDTVIEAEATGVGGTDGGEDTENW